MMRTSGTYRRSPAIAASPIVPAPSTATIAAVLLGDTVPAAVALVLAQMVVYVAVYMRLVRGHWGRCRHPAVILGLRPQPRSEAI